MYVSLQRGEGVWRIFNTFDSQQQLAIVAAASAGHHDVARYLLEEGANVNLVRLYSSPTQCSETGRSNEPRQRQSSSYDDVHAMLLMMRQQLKALPSGTTAFLAAAERGDIRMLGLLLSHGADPMAEDSEGRCGLEVGILFNVVFIRHAWESVGAVGK